jgi:hypothetical protein
MAFENPPYEVLDKDGHFELRRYDDYIVAEVFLSEGYESALSVGFRILADYIFGHNRSSEHIAMTVPVTEQSTDGSEKVAMTAPVTAQQHSSGDYVVAFMMPSKYSMDTLPHPVDQRISFRVIQGHLAASVKFSGSFNEKAAHARETEVRAWMRQRQLSAAAAPIYANYSPPWIPPPFRRNEVIIDVIATNAR